MTLGQSTEVSVYEDDLGAIAGSAVDELAREMTRLWRQDPLRDPPAEELAIYEHAAGRVCIEPRDLYRDEHRSLLAIIDRSPQSRLDLARHAETLLLFPSVARAYRTAAEFREWWQWIGGHDRDSLPDDLAGYLRGLAQYREIRSLGIEVARAAEAQNSAEIIQAMRRVADVLREMGVHIARRAA
jgi:hypothetical protein